MEPTVNMSPAINEMADIQPGMLPDADMTLPVRVSNIEEELDINY